MTPAHPDRHPATARRAARARPVAVHRDVVGSSPAAVLRMRACRRNCATATERTRATRQWRTCGSAHLRNRGAAQRRGCPPTRLRISAPARLRGWADAQLHTSGASR